MSDKIGSKVLAAIDRAITGKPRTMPERKDWAFEAVKTICQLAIPKVKSALGSDWTVAQKCRAEQKRFVKLLNFDLTEVAAHQAHARQVEQHQKHISEGGDPVAIERGRSREAWVADIESRRLAVTAAIQATNRIYKPLQAKIIAMVVQCFLEQCADLMLAESRLAAKFCIPYAESPTLQTLRSLESYIRNRGDTIILDLEI